MLEKTQSCSVVMCGIENRLNNDQHGEEIHIIDVEYHL